MSLATPDAIVKVNVFGYIFEDDGTTPVVGGTAIFESEPFQLNGNLVTIDNRDNPAVSDNDGRYQLEIPVTLEGNVGIPVRVEVKYTTAAGRVKKKMFTVAVDGTVDPIEIDDAVIEKIDNFIIKRGTQGPQGVPGPAGAPGTVAIQTVTDINNPTEVESLTLAGTGSVIIAREVKGAGAVDEIVNYIYDANGPAKNAPYVMNTGDGGTTRWVAQMSNVTNNTPQNANVDRYILAAEITKLAGIATGAEVNPDLISQAEAEAGTAATERIFSALRVAQAFISRRCEVYGVDYTFLVNATDEVIPLDTLLQNGSKYSLDNPNDELDILEAGDYEVTISGYFIGVASTSYRQCDIFVERATSVGAFSELARSRAAEDTRTTRPGTFSRTFRFTAAANDRLRLVGNVSTQAVNTELRNFSMVVKKVS